MKDFREILGTDSVYVFDGAMGTRLYHKGIYINRSYDELNLTSPDLVREVGGPLVGRHVAHALHLAVAFDWKTVPAHDVVAQIAGSTWPDEWVIHGNHHDAWVNGADDPISGQAAMLEEARMLGELHRQGWTPKRTIIYCAWDGEEPGLLGSVERGGRGAIDKAAHIMAPVGEA